MKKIISLLTLCIALTGCVFFSKTATPAQKAAEVQRLSQFAASTGTRVALLENPAYRPAFELAYTNLNDFVTQNRVTDANLKAILDTLPVKQLKDPKAQLIIGSAIDLYNLEVGQVTYLTNSVYATAAATGIRDGLKTALGK